MKALPAYWPFAIASVLWLPLSPCASGEPGYAPLFADHTPLEVTIEAPLETLLDERPDEDYLDSKFRYTDESGTLHTLDVKLRTRGNFRRREKICQFPPLRLNFREKQVVGTLLDGQDKLKLVTHCQQQRPDYEQYMLREFLVYRILAQLTERSFGVRLLQIDYVDTEGRNSRLKYGFVLEDVEYVAKRNGMRVIQTGNIKHADLDRADENLVNVFMYMIGNTDFSLIQGPPDEGCCHNSMLLSASDGPPYTPLPYDFDFSGLVDAPYAAPNPRFRLRSVRSRLYRGQCANNDLLPQTLRHFVDRKDAIYSLVQEFPALGPTSSRETIRYLDSFYYAISNPDTIRLEFLDQCVGAG